MRLLFGNRCPQRVGSLKPGRACRPPAGPIGFAHRPFGWRPHACSSVSVSCRSPASASQLLATGWRIGKSRVGGEALSNEGARDAVHYARCASTPSNRAALKAA